MLINHRVVPGSLCLCRLFSKDPANYWTGLDYHLSSRTPRWGAFTGDPLISQSQGLTLGFLGNVYLLPLIPIPFSYLEEAGTVTLPAERWLLNNRQCLEHGADRAGYTFPIFLQLPARPKERVPEPSRISASFSPCCGTQGGDLKRLTFITGCLLTRYLEIKS